MPRRRYSLRPLRGNVTIKPDPPETETAAGLHIPDFGIEPLSAEQAMKNGGKRTAVSHNGRTPSGRGTVATIGNGYRDKKTGKLTPILVRPGDRVIYRLYKGHDIVMDGEHFLLLDEADILAWEGEEHMRVVIEGEPQRAEA